MRRLAVVIVLVIVSRSGGVRYSQPRFNCPSQTLSSPVVLKDSTGRIDQFCKDFEVQLEDLGENEQDDAVSLCLEASHSPLPGKNEAGPILCSNVPVRDMEEDFNSKIRSKATVCDGCESRCGTFYLHVSLVNASRGVLSFDSLTLRRECSDSPSLSLSVTTKSNQVIDGLLQGSENPFDIIGIEKVTVRNEVRNCTQGKTGTGGCGEQTALATRHLADVPEVLAFFVPLNTQDMAFIDQAGLGFRNFTGKEWFLNQPEEMRKLIKLGLEDMNMFDKPIFLHEGNLLSLKNQLSVESVGVGQEVGKLDLSKTKLPVGVGYGGLLIIALDPLWKINDLDRTDNVFVQYVKVNGTDSAGEWVENPLCMAEGVGLGERVRIH